MYSKAIDPGTKPNEDRRFVLFFPPDQKISGKHGHQPSSPPSAPKLPTIP